MFSLRVGDLPGSVGLNNWHIVSEDLQFLKVEKHELTIELMDESC